MADSESYDWRAVAERETARAEEAHQARLKAEAWLRKLEVYIQAMRSEGVRVLTHCARCQVEVELSLLPSDFKQPVSHTCAACGTTMTGRVEARMDWAYITRLKANTKEGWL